MTRESSDGSLASDLASETDESGTESDTDEPDVANSDESDLKMVENEVSF